MYTGSAFHAERPACEKARSPSFGRRRGCVKSVDDADRRPERVQHAPMDTTMFVRYAGHVPKKIE